MSPMILNLTFDTVEDNFEITPSTFNY